MQHDWIKSTLGHGNTMCRRCWVTDMEAAAIGMAECDPPQPKAANTNLSQEQIDDELSDDDGDDLAGDDDEEAFMNCGKYPGSNGCSLAGTEWCDWSCPFSR